MDPIKRSRFGDSGDALPTAHHRGGVYQAKVEAAWTVVELTWIEGKIERWIRFGRVSHEVVVDRRHRRLSFSPGVVFALVRWAANDFGTVLSRIDIVRSVVPGESFQTIPLVAPGGEILLRVSSWPKVEQVLNVIDAVESLGIDASSAAPTYWRHVHNRMAAREPWRRYSRSQHEAWLMRRDNAR